MSPCGGTFRLSPCGGTSRRPRGLEGDAQWFVDLTLDPGGEEHGKLELLQRLENDARLAAGASPTQRMDLHLVGHGIGDFHERPLGVHQRNVNQHRIIPERGTGSFGSFPATPAEQLRALRELLVGEGSQKEELLLQGGEVALLDGLQCLTEIALQNLRRQPAESFAVGREDGAILQQGSYPGLVHAGGPPRWPALLNRGVESDRLKPGGDRVQIEAHVVPA